MYEFLKKDLAGLESKLAEVSDELRKVNADAADWTRQSSETWHDNFGFEEGERQKRALMIRIDEIRRIKDGARVVMRPTGESVAVGTRVTVVDEGGSRQSFTVSSYMVLQKRIANEVSYEAPIAKPLLSHQIGDEIEVRTGANLRVLEIVSIEVEENLF